jgi:hypothetical protein
MSRIIPAGLQCSDFLLFHNRGVKWDKIPSENQQKIFMKLIPTFLIHPAFSADFETIRQLKEELCYVAYNVEQEQKLALETTVLTASYTVSQFNKFV